MSGFVGVFNLDGAPVDPALMHRLTDALSFRGPDSHEIWLGGSVGLGHALLQTKNDGREQQPCSLDNAVWITGDVRVDGRAELIRSLSQGEDRPLHAATDPELVLHAYRTWGEGLLDHLIGDFSFAIWDSGRKRLLCATDQLGVKPFYFAQLGKQLIVSNTMSCLRAHGSVPTQLNDAAVADFLLVGFNANPETTFFKAIQRLPGGHSLAWSPGRDPVTRRYWSMPRFDILRLARPRDYAERFRTILESAISDRLRTDRVSAQMSGGLDSSLIAAIAQRLLGQANAPAALRAHTVVHDKLFDDPERHFAGLAARHSAIPIEYLPADDFRLLEARLDPSDRFPEPHDSHSRPRLLDSLHQQIAAHGRVALTGWDGDAILQSSPTARLATLLRGFRFGPFIAEAFRFARAKQGLAQAVTRRLRWRQVNTDRANLYPTWLNPDFERRLDLPARWSELHQPRSNKAGNAARAPAYETLAHPTWRPLLEGFDPGTTGFQIDYRHPLLDLRVLGFALSLPAIPWCVDKHILRLVGHGLMPKAIVARAKTPLQGDPVPVAIKDYLARSPTPFAIHSRMREFIDPARIPELIDALNSDDYSLSLRGLIINQWLFNGWG